MRAKRNPAESLCYWTLALTWPLYAIGGLYIAGPAIGWVLLVMTGLSLFLGKAMRSDLKAAGPIPTVVWLWMIGVAAMLIILWIGHIDWDLGSGEMIKSSIGWAKGWALAALFPLAGAVLPIRREPIIRAMGVVAVSTLIVTPFLLVSPYLHLPSRLFVSPLSIVGGPGPDYFAVFLYTIDPENMAKRWQFFLPWCPFAGLVGVNMIMFCVEDRKFLYSASGWVAGLAMIFLSSSRMSLIAVLVCVLLPRLAPLVRLPGTWIGSAAVAASMAVFGNAAMGLVQNSMAAFKGARVSSSRVRDTLQRIALDRWGKEAPLFGHGAVERGPHLVEYMPIGSHHTWFGLLYVKGLTGFLSLLIPMVYQFWFAMVDATRGKRGRLPFGIMLLLLQLTFGENLEIELYIFWPAFLILGIHAREVLAEQLAARAARGQQLSAAASPLPAT